MEDEKKKGDGGVWLGFLFGSVCACVSTALIVSVIASSKPVPYILTTAAAGFPVGHLTSPPGVTAAALDRQMIGTGAEMRFSLTNTGGQTITSLRLDCEAFGENGNRVTEGEDAFTNVRPSETVEPRMYLVPSSPMKRWSCQVIAQH